MKTFATASAFTLHGDPEQMARLESLRKGWTSQSLAEQTAAAKLDSNRE